jgi:hypothetical protein
VNAFISQLAQLSRVDDSMEGLSPSPRVDSFGDRVLLLVSQQRRQIAYYKWRWVGRPVTASILQTSFSCARFGSAGFTI